MKSTKKHLVRGFTLVELLIVVIIIAILAAVLVPQFSGSTDDAKTAALDSTLGNMRTAIDLYYQQHGHYPSAVTSVSTDTCAAGIGTGLINTETAFTEQLTKFTNTAGGACGATDANHKYGPYLRKADIPDNPLSAAADPDGITIVSAGVVPLAADATPATGWKYDNVTGQFIANDTTLQDR